MLDVMEAKTTEATTTETTISQESPKPTMDDLRKTIDQLNENLAKHKAPEPNCFNPNEPERIMSLFFKTMANLITLPKLVEDLRKEVYALSALSDDRHDDVNALRERIKELEDGLGKLENNVDRLEMDIPTEDDIREQVSNEIDIGDLAREVKDELDLEDVGDSIKTAICDSLIEALREAKHV